MHSTPRSSSGEISPSRFVSYAAKIASSWCGGSSGAATRESIRWHCAFGSSSSRSSFTRIWREVEAEAEDEVEGCGSE